VQTTSPPRFARVNRVYRAGRWNADVLVEITESPEDPAGRRIRPVVASDYRRATNGPGTDGPAIDGTAKADRIAATLLPPLTDAHVHLGLCDFTERGGGALARVIDLGSTPEQIAAHVTVGAQRWPATSIVWAGQFVTAPGGYPATRPWAPPGMVAEVASPEEAVLAVRRQHASGATFLKLSLHDELPLLTTAALEAAVAQAHRLGLVVVAHVEGAGQAARAWRAGVDAFAHAPFSERLAEDELAAMADAMVWISTLDMHGRGEPDEAFAIALTNLARFAAHGGRVAYGTDLGNAIDATDVNDRELAALQTAGIRGASLLDALTGAGLLPRWSSTASLIPRDVLDPDLIPTEPGVSTDIAAELAVEVLTHAVPVHPATLLEYAS
jgi:hypothetical protein